MIPSVGATPIFVDVCKDDFLLDIDSLKRCIKMAIDLGLKPAAIIPVDLWTARRL